MSMSLYKWLLPFVMFGALGAINAQNATEDNLRRADKQFDLYAFNLAQKSYQAIVDKEPYNAHALARLGDCYRQLNRPEDALPWYDRATSQTDVKADVLLHYGQALLSTGNYTAAKKWFLFYMEKNKEVGRHYADLCDYAVFNAGKEALYQAQNEALNTAAADFSPTFYGKKVVYNSSRSDMTRKGKNSQNADWSGSNYNQLFATQMDSKTGTLQKPAFLKSEIASAYNEGPVSFSGNGKRVAFCRNNFVDGTRQIAATGINMSLYIADVVDGDWVNVKAFPYNGSEYATGFPCLSADGNTLYFANNNNEGGNGGWDIYVTTWNGKSWATPSNLGSKINSPGDEITPYYDGKNLYFSSDWHMGFGGLDVFKAEAEKGEWTKIFHLGPGINSPRDDYGFVFDATGNIGYITSNRTGGKGNEDIWKIQKKTDDFVINVVDAANKPLAETTLDFSACKGGEFVTNAAGQYAFSVTIGQANCTAIVKKKGYRDGSLVVDSKGEKNIQVVLESDATAKFVGKVQDYTTKGNLAEVEVRALPMPKGNVVETTTDKNGAYTLVLEVKKTYKIQYSKDGYADTMMTLLTADAKSMNEISTMTLMDAEALIAEKKKAIAGVSTSAKPEVETAPKPVMSSTEKPVASKEATTTVVATKEAVKTDAKPEKTDKAESPIIYSLKEEKEKINGFAVQIASVGGVAGEKELKNYDNLRSFGNIYVIPSGKMSKIRLGIYSSREEAENIIKKVTALNYKGAFVVEEKAMDSKLLVVKPMVVATQTAAKTPEEKPADKPAATVRPTEKPAEPTVAETKPTAVLNKAPLRFAVQVASLKNDETVNLAPYMSITLYGNVYTRPENDVTKIRVGVWETHEEADEAQDQIVKKGFKDAVVVTEKSIASTERFLIKKAAEPTKKGVAKPEEQPKKEVEKKGAPSNNLTPKGTASADPKPVEHATKTAKPASNSLYKVRLGTYADPTNFQAEDISGVDGTIVKQKSGRLTIFLLGGYEDLEAAINAKNDAREHGFKDAHVVKDLNGKLVKLKL